MKLTDEVVAMALGWTAMPIDGREVFFPPKKQAKKWARYLYAYPAFTTSLDTIVAEIEARRLPWNVAGPWKITGMDYCASVNHSDLHRDKTAPLALCAALLQYIKSERGPK